MKRAGRFSRALKSPKASGAIVVAVERDSPASRAGLQAGDVITEFNGTVVVSADDLIPRVSSTSPGTATVIKVVRNGQVRTLRIAVERCHWTRRDRRRSHRKGWPGVNAGRHHRRHGAPYAAAQWPPLLIEVTGGGRADDAGVHAGDVVREINRRVVHNATEATSALSGLEPGTPVFLLVWRQVNELFLQIRPE